MKALIVEDEAMARASLVRLVSKNFPDISIVGELDSISSTLAFLERNPDPDIIFMDVELSDGECFEIFRQREVHSYVVMTTAYDNYALKAFEAGSVDYLLKPISVDALQRAVNRCRERGNKGTTDMDAIYRLLNSSTVKHYKERIVVRVGDKYIPVSVAEISCFISEDKSNYITMCDGTKYIIDLSLDQLESELNPQQFFRIGRGCIVCRNAVESVARHINGRLKLNVRPSIEDDLFVSRARVDDFLGWLES